MRLFQQLRLIGGQEPPFVHFDEKKYPIVKFDKKTGKISNLTWLYQQGCPTDDGSLVVTVWVKETNKILNRRGNYEQPKTFIWGKVQLEIGKPEQSVFANETNRWVRFTALPDSEVYTMPLKAAYYTLDIDPQPEDVGI